MASPPRPGRRPVLNAAALAALLAATGCGTAKVEVEQAYAGPRLPQPSRVLVRDFATSPQDVTLDQGLRGRVTQAFSAESLTAQRLDSGRRAASALAEALVETLADPNLMVERVPPGAAMPPGRTAVVDGRLLSVDEGNRTRRTMIGLGRGQSRMVAAAGLFWVEGDAPPRLLESFDSATDSGRAPGMAESLGIGAEARRLATSAAAGGGMHGAIEGSSADDADEAQRIGVALGKRLKQFFAEQGWVAAAR